MNMGASGSKPRSKQTRAPSAAKRPPSLQQQAFHARIHIDLRVYRGDAIVTAERASDIQNNKRVPAAVRRFVEEAASYQSDRCGFTVRVGRPSVRGILASVPVDVAPSPVGPVGDTKSRCAALDPDAILDDLAEAIDHVDAARGVLEDAWPDELLGGRFKSYSWSYASVPGKSSSPKSASSKRSGKRGSKRDKKTSVASTEAEAGRTSSDRRKRSGYIYRVDLAPTGRARCKGCGEPIAKGALRLAKCAHVEQFGGREVCGFWHPAHLVAYAAAHMRDKSRKPVMRNIDGKDKLSTKERDELKAQLSSSSS